MGADTATLTDLDVLALTLYGEARGEPVEGKIGVGCVIRNRVHAGRWGDTYTKVCQAPFQFSCWNLADPNRTILDGLISRIEAGQNPTVSDAALRECYWVAGGILGEQVGYRVGTATHYYADRLIEVPGWAATGQVVAHLGGHVFLAGVR